MLQTGADRMSAGEMTVVLPAELAKLVEAELGSGRYNSTVEVFRDALRALAERDDVLEDWLREEVVRGHQEYVADPSKAVPAADALAWIKSHRND
jgi:antitoxin ParD1/3/4